MTLAVTVGAYKLPHFVRLNVLRCRRIFGQETSILISDDKSSESTAIEGIAKELGCDYIVSKRRMSHFSGDAQAFLNAIVYGRECGVDVALKLSQRLIIVRPEFRSAIENAFLDPEVQIALPGRIPKHQISRPGARFFARFGLLSDVVAIRPTAIEPEEFLEIYRDRCAPGRHPSDSFVETSLGFLLAHRFPGNRHRILNEWSEHKLGTPKLYLRKSQSSTSDYAQVAAMEGMPYDVSQFDCREWREIEARDYRPKASVV